MTLPDIHFGPECDNFSLFSVLDMLNIGHRSLEPDNGDVYLEFVLADATILPGSYAGHDDNEWFILIQEWDGQKRVPTENVVRVPMDQIARIDYP